MALRTLRADATFLQFLGNLQAIKEVPAEAVELRHHKPFCKLAHSFDRSGRRANGIPPETPPSITPRICAQAANWRC
jgi:hypothetical protein